jgi:hypothetical protein
VLGLQLFALHILRINVNPVRDHEKVMVDQPFDQEDCPTPPGPSRIATFVCIVSFTLRIGKNGRSSNLSR